MTSTRILLIEDEESDYLLTRRMLCSIKSQAFEVEWASSWQEGIEALRRNSHDVCLLDYRIGGGDGLELLKEAQEIGYKAPVILLSGISDQRLDAEASKMGAAEFLIKDKISPAVLERSIRYAITHRQMIDELCKAKDEAEQASEAKSDFIARMSHELRTPLHAIIGFTKILQQNRPGNLNDQQIDLLERICVNAQDQLQLINGILDLSKIEAGRMEVHLAPVAVDSLVREVIKQVEGDRANPGVELVLRLPDSVRPIMTDGAKLKQIVLNLVDNALKFTEQGTVRVKIAVHPLEGTPTRIDVTDTGVGIPSDRLKDIFEPFLQIENRASQRFSGTGLGLSICYSLCELLGYGMRVRSRPGRGSRFSILLRTEAAGMSKSA